MIRTRYLNFFLLTLSGLTLILLFNSTVEYHQYKTVNENINVLQHNRFISPDELDLTQAEVRFAYAYQLQQQLLFEESLTAYGIAEQVATAKDITKIKYNIANLYLQHAITLAEKGHIDRSVALADVAKSHYQTVLKSMPSFWNAKYNFEAAQRLSRDLPLGKIRTPKESTENSTELWSAMPGFPVGLP